MLRFDRRSLLALGAGAALTGCGSRDPWAGVDATGFVRLEEHRREGLAALERGKPGASAAVREFSAIRDALPGEALGPLNLAVAHLLAGQPRPALNPAREAVELLPSRSLPRIVLARALEADGQQDAAEQGYQYASRGEPDNPQALGVFVEHLTRVPDKDQSKRLFPRRKRLAQMLPQEPAARFAWFFSLVERGHAPEALEELGTALRTLPDPAAVEGPALAALRRALQAPARSVPPDVRPFEQVLLSCPAYAKSRRALFGDPGHPEDLALRQWDHPPPPRLARR
ncbi:MAG: hypothetical protein FJX77_13345 [Armatimonadetes bacterium]|nr:hypothetical protein [Armatimonadota bacterium]